MEKIAECLAEPYLPDIYGDVIDRWDASSPNERLGYVNNRRSCRCEMCCHWQKTKEDRRFL